MELHRPIESVSPPHSEVQQPWPNPARAWYGVSVFALVVMVLFMNHGTILLLVDLIKRDLQLTDTQVSLIIGFASAALTAVISLFVARLVDMMSRRVLLGVGLLLISIMTAVSSSASTFFTLFIARMFVGVGGAANGPATYSILADYFPPEKLPKAVSVMNIGFTYGQAAALLLGGTLIAAVSHVDTITLPVLGEMRPWQLVFLFMAIPDFILGVLILLTVHEPKRRGVRAAHTTNNGPKTVPISEVLKFLWANRRAYGPMFGGLAATSLAAGTLAWTPVFYMRTYGWSPAQYGIISGVLTLVISPIGLLAGGLLAERLAKKGFADANLRVLFLTSLAHIPFSILYPLMPTPYLALAVGALNATLMVAGSGPQNAALQVITPNEMRGQITALFLFIFTMVGIGVAPTLVALVTDFIFADEQKLRYSIVVINTILGPVAAWIFWWGLKPYGQAFTRAQAWVR